MAEARSLQLMATRPCMSCGRDVAAGEPIFWDATAGKPVCTPCHDAPDSAVFGTAEGTRRRGRTEGERRFLRILEGLDRRQCVLLHDRIQPETRQNVDHIAICSRGVYVFEVSLTPGRVAMGDVSRWGGTDPRLFIDGKEASHLLSGVRRQAGAVRDALLPGTPILPTVCFVEADIAGFTRSFQIDGVRITPTSCIHQLVAKEGFLGPADVQRISAALDKALPPASSVPPAPRPAVAAPTAASSGYRR
jgi:hypothetical protein